MVGVIDYFGQVGTRKWIYGGCARIFCSRRYAEMDRLWVR